MELPVLMSRYLAIRLLRGRLALPLLLCLVAGCQTSGPIGDGEAPEFPWDAPQDEPLASTSGEMGDATASEQDEPPVDEETVRLALADDGWFRLSALGGATTEADAESRYEWQHEKLALLLARDKQPLWRSFLAEDDALIRANAAIALARAGDEADVDGLVAAIDAAGLKLAVRLAAAETLVQLQDGAAHQAVDELLTRYGDPEAADSRYVADLHVALLPGLVREATSTDDARILSAMTSRSPNVRQAALTVWADLAARSAPTSVPRTVADATSDPDTNVRRAAIAAIAQSGDPEAVTWLTAAMDDHDLSARLDAIRALSAIEEPRADSQLAKVMAEGGELDRVAAAEGFAQAGRERPLLAAAEDSSWRVRRVVAAGLGDAAFASQPSPAAARVMNALVVDKNSLVQLAAVASLTGWKLQAAVPLLLAAIEQGGFHARQLAVRQLADRWPPAESLALDAAGAIAPGELDQLRDVWQRTHGEFASIVAEQQRDEPTMDFDVRLSQSQLDGLEQIVGRLARGEVTIDACTAQLAASDLDPVLALEQLVVERSTWLPPSLDNWLATQDEVHALLGRLESEKENERRLTARELAERMEQQPLGPLAMQRLARALAVETDPLVWQSLGPGLAEQPSEILSSLAIEGLTHDAAYVRQWACEYLTRYPNPRASTALRQALTDDADRVVLAAVQACTEPGVLEESAPLFDLLEHPSPAVRIEAAAALVLRGEPAGMHALERAAHHGDPRVRTAAAERVAELGRPELTGLLVGQLDDPRLSVCRAAMRGLTVMAGFDAGRPAEDPSPRLSDEIRRWKQWWTDKQAAVAELPSESSASSQPGGEPTSKW